MIFDMQESYNQAAKALEYIRSKTKITPDLAIVLGTGLSTVVKEMTVDVQIPYKSIPGFLPTTVAGHSGKLMIGRWQGTKVVILSGRLHYYEGYTMDEIILPMRVLGLWRIAHVILTNVSGGINPMYEPGDLVLLKDHIYMMPQNPLRGQNDERFGPRFPDMSEVYDKKTRQKILNYCQDHDIRTHEGVYYCLQGPSLETPAEYQYIYKVGGDLVGMSTIPEVIVARHMDLSVTVISIVSNVCYPPSRITPTTIEDVIQTAEQATPSLIQAIKCALS